MPPTPLMSPHLQRRYRTLRRWRLAAMLSLSLVFAVFLVLILAAGCA